MMHLGNMIKRLFRLPQSEPPKLHPDEIAIHDEALKLLPLGSRLTLRYPPFLEGFPASISTERLLDMQEELLFKIKRGIGLPVEDIEQMIKPALMNYARFVHLLPASENHHHCGPGGLLRHGLEVAFFTMNCAKNSAFDSRLPPSKRSLRNSRWVVAGALCGLFHDTGKAVTDMRVVFSPEELEWDYTASSIEEWSNKHRLEKYYIEWQKGRHKKHVMRSRDLFSVLCPQNTLSWLREGGDDIIDAILDAIVGNEESPLYEALMVSDGKSTKADMATGDSPQYMTGVPVIKLVNNAMTRLIKEEQWKINEPGARVWTTTQGVFVAWNSGAKEIIDLILSDNIQGIPRTPTSLLMRLCDEHVAEIAPDGEMFWEIAPDCIQKNPQKPLILRCMKVASPDTLFPYDPVPAPISVRIQEEGQLVAYPTAEDAKAQSQTVPATKSDEVSDGAEDNPGVDSKPEQKKRQKPKQAKSKGNSEKNKAAQNAESPVLTPSPSSSQEQTVKLVEPEADDPVLARMADVELNGGDEQSQQDFVNAALLCFSGLPEDNAGNTASGDEPQQSSSDQSDKPALISLNSQHRDERASTSNANSNRAKKGRIKLIGNKPRSQPVADAPVEQTRTSKPVLKPNHKKEPATVSVETKAAAVTPQATSVDLSGLTLDKAEAEALKQAPELAEIIVSLLRAKTPLLAYNRRVFIPLSDDAGISKEQAAQLHAGQWLWEDFTALKPEYLFNNRNRMGVIPADWLSEIICKNVSEPIPNVISAAFIGAEKAKALLPLAEALIANSVQEELPNGQTVQRIYQRAAYKIATEKGFNQEDSMDALFLYRSSVIMWGKKAVFFMPAEWDKNMEAHNV